jgi:hypothetical protein
VTVTTNKFVFTVLLAGVVALLALLHVYVVRDDGGAYLLWNGHDADLFVCNSPRGFRISYLRYPWVILEQYLNAPPLPDNEKMSAAVIHVTSSAVERYDLDVPEGSIPPSIQTPIAGEIYANCEGSLCKWAGTHFEPASEEERRRLDGLDRLIPNDIDGGANRWSKRSIGYALHDYQFSVGLGQDVTLKAELTNTQKAAYSKSSVYVLRTGKAPQRIWYLDGYPKSVSRAEYNQLFQRR